jgi:predicted Zn-dependent peptidase
MYVGTREDNVAEACEVIADELESLRSTPVSDDELGRAKEHVKGRTVLVLESTSARMSRNASAVLFDLPLLGIDEVIAKIDAVTIEDVAELAAELYAAERISAACIGADEDCFRKAVAPIGPALV